eukprot:403354038
MNAYDSLENSLKLINTQLGRDKMCRFIQYFIKFIVPHIAAKGPQNNDIKERLEKLGGNMSMTRKVLRFGKPIPLIKTIIDRFAEHQKKPVRMFWLRTINDISLILYFLTDHPMYFQKVGLVKMEKDLVNQIDYINNLTWLVNAVLDVVCDLSDFMHMQNEIKVLKKSGDPSNAEVRIQIKQLQANSFIKLLSVIRASADIPVIFHFMGSDKIGSSFAGFLGTISSSVSLYNLWGK